MLLREQQQLRVKSSSPQIEKHELKPVSFSLFWRINKLSALGPDLFCMTGHDGIIQRTIKVYYFSCNNRLSVALHQ